MVRLSHDTSGVISHHRRLDVSFGKGGALRVTGQGVLAVWFVGFRQDHAGRRLRATPARGGLVQRGAGRGQRAERLEQGLGLQ